MTGVEAPSSLGLAPPWAGVLAVWKSRLGEPWDNPASSSPPLQVLPWVCALTSLGGARDLRVVSEASPFFSGCFWSQGFITAVETLTKMSGNCIKDVASCSQGTGRVGLLLTGRVESHRSCYSWWSILGRRACKWFKWSSAYRYLRVM